MTLNNPILLQNFDKIFYNRLNTIFFLRLILSRLYINETGKYHSINKNY
uniref:Uncharacterized protein n=1 Tax=viral metagenome TaxID=1070528 RepID=A0A6C0H5H6_9ZZZZ